MRTQGTLTAVVLTLMCLQATLAKKGKNKKKQEQVPEWVPKSSPGKGERLHSVGMGEDIKLDCQAKGKPSPKVAWFKDGQKLEKGHSRLTIKKHRLTISSLVEEDKGNYSCVVSNNKGRLEWTFYVDVIVKVWPLELQGPKNITAAVGQTVRFHCRVLNDPTATVWWQKMTADFMESTGRQEFLNTTGNPELLELTNVLPGHAGEYRCAVSNIRGLKYSSAFLTVVVPTTTETTRTSTTTMTTTTPEIPTTPFVLHSSEVDFFESETIETTHQTRRNNNDRRKPGRRRKPPKSKATTSLPFFTTTYSSTPEMTKIWNHQEGDWPEPENEEAVPEDNGQLDSGEGWISVWTIYTIVGAVGGVILLIGLLAITIAVCCRRDEAGSYKSTPV